MNPVSIRPWVEADREPLEAAVAAYFEDTKDQGSMIEPTPANVSRLVTVGIEAAAAGWPSLAIYVEAFRVEQPWKHVAERVAAMILWRDGRPEGFESNALYCHAMMSWTAPDCRHRMLRESLEAMAIGAVRAMGVKAIWGPVAVANQRGIEKFLAKGARVVSFIMQREP